MKSNWMQQIQTLIGQKAGAMGGAEGIGKLLAPTALGGPVGVLLANKSSRKLVGKFGKNALIVGGSAAVGAVLWNKYKQRVKETHQGEPRFGLQTTPVDLRAKRPCRRWCSPPRATAISMPTSSAPSITARAAAGGEEAQGWVQEALDQPLNPELIARSVQNEDEALEVYYLSCHGD